MYVHAIHTHTYTYKVPGSKLQGRIQDRIQDRIQGREVYVCVCIHMYSMYVSCMMHVYACIISM